MKHSRTTNTVLNFISGISGEVLSMLMQFICRTVFIYTLGRSFLGISSLFANILTMLTLAEFGVGNAILYKLYDPVENDDRKRINMILRFSKNAYKIIGITVAVLGVATIPFLPFFVKEYDSLAALHVNAVLIFTLYLLQSVTSYFFLAYKSAILQANQKVYVINMTVCIGSLVSRLVQIAVLIILTKVGVPLHIVFLIYVSIQIVTVVIQNCINAFAADRMYPFIKDDPGEKLSKEEVRGILKDCSALFIYRLDYIVLKSTDNIVISKYLGLTAVALYSNYYVLYTTINSVFLKIYESVVNSLGNKHTQGDLKGEYRIFKSVSLITSILGATAGIGIFVCADEFIEAWIGKDWMIPGYFSMFMGIELYSLSIHLALDKYRTAMGLFRQVKYRPLFSMTINLVVSVLLVKNWGITGVIVGTIIADYSTILWFDPIVIHRHGFKGEFSTVLYFLKRLYYSLITAAAGLGCKLLCTHFLTGLGWISVISHAIICVIAVPAVFLLVTVKTEENSYVIELGKNEIDKFKNKLIRKKS